MVLGEATVYRVRHWEGVSQKEQPSRLCPASAAKSAKLLKFGSLKNRQKRPESQQRTFGWLVGPASPHTGYHQGNTKPRQVASHLTPTDLTQP